jgi:heme/copper-type cytochrome/quinol oxidase subunit 4
MNTVINNSTSKTYNMISWFFGLIVLIIGISNLIWVHPVPGSVFLLLSLIYFPPLNNMLRNRWNIVIALFIKIILGIIIIWFTLGVSDLGDMIDDL